MKRASTCIASLLALPLATTFAGNADANIVYDLTVNPTLDLVDSFLFVASSFSGFGLIQQTVDLGPFAADTNQSISFTDNTQTANDNRVVFLGVYQDGETFGLTTSLLGRETLNETNPDFLDLFPSLFFGEPDELETDIINDLRTGSVVDVFQDGIEQFVSVDPDNPFAQSFVEGFAFPRFSVDGVVEDTFLGFNEPTNIQLGNFSTLSDGGTLGVTVNGITVPEPASVALLGLGGLILAGRRRR